MPDGPIIDAHVHLWDPNRFRMPWLDALPALDRPFGLEDYREQTRGVGGTGGTGGVDVAALVYVEVGAAPEYGLLEAQWAVATAGSGAVDRAAAVAGVDGHGHGHGHGHGRDTPPRVSGVVAFAPLEHGDRARAYLEAVVALGPLVKGVRRLIQGEPDPSFCVTPAFVRGVSLLGDLGLSFDLCIRHAQLPAAIELVRRCPAVTFVLDHIAKPDIAAQRLDPWRDQLRTLAACPNIVCKISGLVTEADLARWQPADLAPFVTHVLDCFGEDRVLFGSDWPVMLLASGFARWVDTLDRLTASLSPAAQRKLWAGNAARIYRLADPPASAHMTATP